MAYTPSTVAILRAIRRAPGSPIAQRRGRQRHQVRDPGRRRQGGCVED
jgi:hypothetical protein